MGAAESERGGMQYLRLEGRLLFHLRDDNLRVNDDIVHHGDPSIPDDGVHDLAFVGGSIVEVRNFAHLDFIFNNIFTKCLNPDVTTDRWTDKGQTDDAK